MNKEQHLWNLLDDDAKEFVVMSYADGEHGYDDCRKEKGDEDPHLQYWIGWCEAVINTFPKDELESAYKKSKWYRPAPSEQKPTPRFKVGDIVKVKNGNYGGSIMKIHNRHLANYGWIYDLGEKSKGIVLWFSESDLAPYTEPEPQQTEETMEEKELNLAELLRKYDVDKIYLVDEGEVELVEIIDKLAVDVKGVDGRPIGLRGETLEIKPTGFAYIYPSKESFLKYPLNAKQAWQIWAEERKPKRWRAKEGERYYWIGCDLTVEPEDESRSTADDECYECGNYFRTKEEAEQAAEAVKRTLEEFHANLAEK